MNPKILLTGILLVGVLIALTVSAYTSTVYPIVEGNAIHETAINIIYATPHAAAGTTATEFTATINPWLFIGSILSIIIGTVILCGAYEIVSADLTTAVACMKL